MGIINIILYYLGVLSSASPGTRSKAMSYWLTTSPGAYVPCPKGPNYLVPAGLIIYFIDYHYVLFIIGDEDGVCRVFLTMYQNMRLPWTIQSLAWCWQGVNEMLCSSASGWKMSGAILALFSSLPSQHCCPSILLAQSERRLSGGKGQYLKGPIRGNREQCRDRGQQIE